MTYLEAVMKSLMYTDTVSWKFSKIKSNVNGFPHVCGIGVYTNLLKKIFLAMYRNYYKIHGRFRFDFLEIILKIFLKKINFNFSGENFLRKNDFK